MDPLLETLTMFSTNEDLSSKIRDLYDRIDVDEGGTVDLSELNAGLKRMNFVPPIHLSLEDFDEMTEQGRLTTKRGPGGEELNAHGFEMMIQRQLRRYTRRMMARAMRQFREHSSGGTFDLMFGIKLVLSSVDVMQSMLSHLHGHTDGKKEEHQFKTLRTQPDLYFLEWKQHCERKRGKLFEVNKGGEEASSTSMSNPATNCNTPTADKVGNGNSLYHINVSNSRPANEGRDRDWKAEIKETQRKLDALQSSHDKQACVLQEVAAQSLAVRETLVS